MRTITSFYSRHTLRLFSLFLLCPFILCGSPWRAAGAELPQVPEQWTISEALDFALKNNPDSRIAAHRINAALATSQEARAALYPRIDLNAEYGQTNNPMYSFGNILNQGVFNQTIDFNDPGVTDNLRLAATLKYNLYNGGRDQAGIMAANAKKQMEEWQRQVVLSHLGFEVVRSFYTIAQAYEIVDARTSAVAAIKSSLAVARARYQAGDLLKTSLLDIEVQLSKAEEQLIQARHGRDLAQRAFLNLLGIRSKEVHLDLAQQVPQRIPEHPDGSLRPELRALDAGIKAAQEQMERARGGYLPRADIFGSYQLDQDLFKDGGNGDSWMAGVQVNYNLFEGQRTSSAVTRARAEILRARELKRKSELDITLELEKAELALEQARARKKVTAKMVELARESARLSREQFKEGVILSSTLLDSETRLTESQVHASLAKANMTIAIADLRRAAGLPQFEQPEQPEQPHSTNK